MSEPARRPALLLVHHDGDLLDTLTRAFEEHGFVVTIAATAFQARTRLESTREYDVVVTEWDARHPVGGELYKWALEHRFHLRGQFIFVADEVPAGFDDVTGGHCLLLGPAETDEIVRVASAAARRRHSEPDAADATLDDDRPTLLLADDDPVLLMVMARLLGDGGFAVTPCESGNAAIAQLDASDFDVVLLDWHMVDGAGADVYTWLATFRPWMVDRIVFLTGGSADAIRRQSHGRPVVPKGQDSQTLLDVLTRTAKGAKRA